MLQAHTPALPLHVRHAEVPAVLTAVYREDVNLAVWQRPAPANVAEAWLVEVAESGFSLRERCPPTLPDLERMLAPTPAGDSRAAFCKDLRCVIELFADLTGAEAVGVRLESVTRDLCAAWHTDKVSLRLITTYQGPSTQWITNDDVWGRHPPRQPGFLVLRAGAVRHSLRAHAIGVFKGEAWPQPHTAIVHRSPPAADGIARLLLTLDPL